MKYITIATDVSCDNRRKIVTWACYIRHSRGVIKEVGQFKQYNKRTAHAETYALINALVIAQKNIPDFKQSKIVIHNEIEHVLDPVMTKAGNVTLRDKERTEAIRSIAIPILQEAVSWERRKIKAHFKDWRTSDSPAKYAINRWCDVSSRELMRSIRDNTKKSTEKLVL